MEELHGLLEKALCILKNREEYYGAKAHQATSEPLKMNALSEASAYSSAWWILWYAMNYCEPELDQFDYFGED